jgi:hypothetical protein
MPTLARPGRSLVAVLALIAGAGVAQVPNIGSSSETGGAATPAAASTTRSATAAAAAKSASPHGAPSALTLVGESDPHTVVFDDMLRVPKADGGQDIVRVADLGITVQAPPGRGGKVAVTYLPSRTGVRQSLSGPPTDVPTLDQSVLFTAAQRPLEVKSGRTTALPLRIAIAADARPTVADGVVRVALVGYCRLSAAGQQPPSPNCPHAKVTPVTLVVHGKGPTLSLEPSPVKLRVTRWLGPTPEIAIAVKRRMLRTKALARREANLRLIGSGAAAVAASPAPHQAVLRSERNGELFGSLRYHPDADLGDGQSQATFRVDSVSMTGKYTGALRLDPAADTPQQVPVEVEVQDAFYVPFIFLFAIAFFGGLSIKRHNINRRRRLAQVALKDAVERYETESAKELLDGMFTPACLDDGTRFPQKRDCDKKDPEWGEVARVWCATYEPVTDTEFKDLGKRVAEIVTQLSRWNQVASEYWQLRKAYNAVLSDPQGRGGLPENDVAMEDTNEVLREAGTEPATDDRVAELVQRLRGQRAVLGVYAQLKAAWDDLGSTDDGRRKREAYVPDCDPESLYKPAAGRDAAATEALCARLSRAVRLVHAAKSRPLPDGDDTAADLVAGLRTARFGAYAERGLPFDDALGSGLLASIDAPPPVVQLPAPPPPVREDKRRARDILDDTKKWDWIIAIVTSAVTVVVFLMPKYASHTFGSWEDYASLAALGLLGSVVTGGLVLDWELFPPLRSYGMEAIATAPATDKKENGAAG